MLTANAEIRQKMKSENVRMWEVADRLGCHENTVIRKLRHELDPDEKRKIMTVINEIRSGR